MDAPLDGPVVTGGTTSVDASLQDMRSHAGRIDRSGDEVRRIVRAVTDLGVALPPTSLAMSPATGAAVTSHLAMLVLGRHGLTGLAVRLEVLARGLRLTAGAYEHADQVARATLERVQIPVGVAITVAVVAREAGQAAAGTALAQPTSVDTAMGELKDRFVDGLGTSVYANPDLTNLAVSGARRYVPGEEFEQEIAFLLMTGRALGAFDHHRTLTVRSLPPRADTPVRDLSGLMKAQKEVLSTPAETDRGTRVRAQRVLGPDGVHRWIVSVPGTQDWSPLSPANPSDLGSNLAALAGKSNPLYPAIAESLELAMRQAGVRPGSEPVMLAGHSQGGLVATRLAADSAFRRRFNVTSVVTAGAPTGRIAVPRDISVLSLEHRQDVVPRLDARNAVDRSNVVRVVLDDSPAPGRQGSVASAHHPLTYARSAQAHLDPDAPLDPQLRQWYSNHDDFLNGTAATSYESLIRRPP
ncbi:hypothetical protein [Demetria terragena]|uniref:PGAP1-like alpha/beta domain-containing protein n=1 Tax=Demetria terragena TaxID=63959 RepID=UPI0003608503|nr:hypothetical protein [Demetria terragena]